MKFGELSTAIKVSGLGIVFVFLMLVFYENRIADPEPSVDDWFVVEAVSDSVVLQGDFARVAVESVGSATLYDLAKRITGSGPEGKGTAALAVAGKTLRLNPGTRVMVVETDSGAALVRVVDGPATGSECWIERTRLEKM